MVTLNVEIADNSLTLAKGLMGRKHMPDDAGMLFKFPMLTEARFWGKDTYMPLDIAFVHNDKIVDINQISPMSTKYVISKSPCTIAIEANSGFFKKNNILVGDIVKINGTKIEFDNV